MIDAAQIQTLLEPLFPGLLGIRLVEVTNERVVATLLVRPELCTTGDTLHGGALMAFADTLGAIGTFVNLPPDSRTTTIDSSTKFIRGSQGRLDRDRRMQRAAPRPHDDGLADLDQVRRR